MSIYSIILDLRKTRSRTEKEAIIKRHVDNTLFKAVLRATYDTSISYYITKVDAVAATNEVLAMPLSAAIKDLIESIASRAVTGADAKIHVNALGRSITADDLEVLRLILKHDLKCGVSSKTINAAFGYELIPVYPYMRCKLATGKALDDMVYPAWSQIKSDGMFLNIQISYGGEATFAFTRTGSTFPLPGYLDKAIMGVLLSGVGVYIDTTLTGELLVIVNGMPLPREIGNGLLNHVSQGGELPEGASMEYHPWDVIPTSDWLKGECAIAYKARYKQLKRMLASAPTPYVKRTRNVKVRNFAEAVADYKEKLSLGLEGTVLKNKKGIWKSHDSPNQLKMKNVIEIDVEVVGFNPGTGKNASYFGSVQTQSACGEFKVNVGVSGFKESERDMLWEMGEDAIGGIMSISINGLMKPDSDGVVRAFLPRYFRHCVGEVLRSDKTIADTLKRMYEIEEASLL